MLLLVHSLKKVKFVRLLSLAIYRSKIKFLLLRKPIIFLAKKTVGFEILTRSKLINDAEKYRVEKIETQELMPFMNACDFNLNFNRMKASAGFVDEMPEKTKKEKFFICEVDNAELAGPDALGFDKDGNIILETALPIVPMFGTPLPAASKGKPGDFIPLEECIPLRALAARFLSKSSVPELDTACSLVNAWGRRHYGHWLTECLARLESVEYYRDKTGIKPTLIIGSNPSSWQVESLKLLGYEPKDCIQWNVSRMKVKRLLVPSFRRSPEELLHISSMACRWLRQRIVSNLPSIKSEKLSSSPNIYISRRNTVGRRVINENEVIEALKPFGFVTYTLEELSFSEQVSLFSQAKLVVSPHGAGLINMIFSENLTVIELFSSLLADDTFFYLAKELGFRYGFLKCNSPRTDFRRRDADIIVNVDDLRALVARV